MHAHTRRGRSIGAVAVTMTVLALLPVQAAAQPSIQRFQPSMDSKGLITLNASQVLGHIDPSLALVVSWARRPLFLSGEGAAADSSYAIDNLLTGNLQAAIGLFGHLEAGLSLPMTLWNGDTAPDATSSDKGGIDAQGAGDLTLHLKGRILNTSTHPVGLALITSLSLPTGDEERFLGTGGVGLAPSLVLDRDLFGGRLSLVLNLGARLQLSNRDGTWTDVRSCAQASQGGAAVSCGTGRQLKNNHLLTLGAGASVGLVPQRLDLVAEVVGQVDLGETDGPGAAAEALAGLRLYLASRSYFSLGVGRGLRGSSPNYSHGSPDFRAFVGFTFEPAVGDRDGDRIKDDVDLCPNRPEDIDDFEDEDGCPDLDNDRDQIRDTDDHCPNRPEDRDGYEDEDGCPEPQATDRDDDGIEDNRDKCPDDPEDRDDFEDEDGCPDLDNDKDRILDTDDLCPNRPEDRDRFEDEDGCPDPDNDKDRILDRDDRCPNEPETRNGYLDDDGCPDKRPFRAHRWKLDVLKKIHFETDKAEIRPISFPILDAIATFLRQTPEILRIEVQGHADERGATDYNLRLTRLRAAAVKRYLVRKGVKGGRLRAKGYGEGVPLDRRHTEEAWSKNRRVEFIIRKRSR